MTGGPANPHAGPVRVQMTTLAAALYLSTYTTTEIVELGEQLDNVWAVLATVAPVVDQLARKVPAGGTVHGGRPDHVRLTASITAADTIRAVMDQANPN